MQNLQYDLENLADELKFARHFAAMLLPERE
jgi:hypothetical protein